MTCRVPAILPTSGFDGYAIRLASPFKEMFLFVYMN